MRRGVAAAVFFSFWKWQRSPLDHHEAYWLALYLCAAELGTGEKPDAAAADRFTQRLLVAMNETQNVPWTTERDALKNGGLL